MLRSIGKQSGETVESVLKKKKVVVNLCCSPVQRLLQASGGCEFYPLQVKITADVYSRVGPKLQA